MKSKSENKIRVGLYLPKKSHEQLKRLSASFNISYSAVVSQSLARWYRQEKWKEQSQAGEHND